MSIIAAYAVPHPPLIIPAVGRGLEQHVTATTAAYERIAAELAAARPDVIVLASSHAPAYRDGFYVSVGAHAHASMANFDASRECFEVTYDAALAAAIRSGAHDEGIPVCSYDPRDEELDHASFIPLWFLRNALIEAANQAKHGKDNAGVIATANASEDVDAGTGATSTGATCAGATGTGATSAGAGNALDTERNPVAATLPPVVRIGLSWLPFETHRALGHVIARAAHADGRRIAFIASGDLSHRLSAEGPYGFRPEGPVFDEQVTDIFRTGALKNLFTISDDLAEAAGECGLRPFLIMAGALEETCSLEGADLDAQLLSYEGPLGVGYAVASFVPRAQESTNTKYREHGADASGAATDSTSADASEAATGSTSADASETAADNFPTDAITNEAVTNASPTDASMPDPYVALARASVEHFVTTGRPLPRPDDLPDELLNRRAGAFVSLHAYGDLRGCIGTISACQSCLADEIIANGISAAAHDPRFSPVRPEELDFINYSVDVLGPAERIASEDELDPVRYGVIVTKDYRRGLLLPNLEGVDTVERQVAIARSKAGIGAWETDVQLQRFEVVRHERGGAARREYEDDHEN